MGREFTTLIDEGTRRLSAFASGLSLRAALLTILASFAGLVWLINTAPPVIGLFVTATVASCWCIWLERHPERSGVPPPQSAVTTVSVVYVLATTAEGTKQALTVAKHLAAGCGTKVLFLPPRLTSFRTQFNPATEDRRKAVDEQRPLAADIGVRITILFCVCHRPEDIVHQMITPSVGSDRWRQRLDDKGLFGGIDQALHEATPTAEYKQNAGFLLRGESRRDWSSELFFPGRLGSR
jgi:hypothetical protein